MWTWWLIGTKPCYARIGSSSNLALTQNYVKSWGRKGKPTTIEIFHKSLLTFFTSTYIFAPDMTYIDKKKSSTPVVMTEGDRHVPVCAHCTVASIDLAVFHLFMHKDKNRHLPITHI